MSIFRVPKAFAELGYTKTPGYEAIRNGLLTTPIKIGARAAGIPVDEVKAIAIARIGGATDDQIRALVCSLHAKRKADAAAVLAGV